MKTRLESQVVIVLAALLVVTVGCRGGGGPIDPESVPIAKAHADASQVMIEEEVCFFDDSVDSPSPPRIVLREWDFSYDAADGFRSESTEPNPCTSYSSPGIYLVQLRLTDSAGHSDMLDSPIEIGVQGEGWARTWGGSWDDVGRGVAVDDSGNVYVTGEFDATDDFDPGSGVDNHTSNGSSDVFLSKFDSSGTFQWARTWGGSHHDGGRDVAVDGSGNVYVTGDFCDTVDFDPGSGVDKHSSHGWQDVFLSRFDSNGAFRWARTWGGSDYDSDFDVAVNGSGNVCVTGVFGQTVDFDTGSGVDNHTANGDRDVFLSRFDPNGAFQWARTWGGSGYDVGGEVALDGLGDTYVTGGFFETVDFDPGSGMDNHASGGDRDAFLSKFDSSGAFVWARTWGGSGYDFGNGVALDGSGNLYVTGGFAGIVDFDPGSGVDNHTANGMEGFLSRFDSNGAYNWARTWGGPALSSGVAAGGSGDVYVTGSFWYTVDFDPGSGADNHTSNGYYDAFVSKFDSSGTFQWAHTWGGSGWDGWEEGYGVAVDGMGSVYVTGGFCETADFDPGDGVNNHTSNGYEDVFLVKFLPDGTW